MFWLVFFSSLMSSNADFLRRFGFIGQDNESHMCSAGDVRNPLVGNRADHSGPYDGVMMGC